MEEQKMTNVERQKKLDKKKWEASIEAGRDKGGDMDYCEFCDKVHPIWKACNATQADREKGCLCAKAYNKSEKAFYKLRKAAKSV